MIVQFSVANYLSFKEMSTLSLATTNLKETAISETDSMTEMGGAIPAVLHGAAIYGANASGKSNFAKAFATFKWLVINSIKELQAGDALDVESFMLNDTTAKEPSIFEIVFCNVDYIFRYGFEVDGVKVHKELPTRAKCSFMSCIVETTRSVLKKWSCGIARVISTMSILRAQ